jgi:acyl-homoserine lactone acylase PvdQ
MKKWLLLLFLPLQLFSQPGKKEISRWNKQAKNVTIIRDNWGIPHIYGKTDADAVFGLLYAQCEDDFKRVEMNYIEKLGRMTEVKGRSSIYDDLLIRMVIDPADAISDYEKAEPWLKKLLNAFADGVNYYLYKHSEVKPALLTRFEPWYPLLWTDGSIGAINTADIGTADLRTMYDQGNIVYNDTRTEMKDKEMLTGSNGFAFSPKITASGNAILYINPHVTFYFRPEAHMVSEEGLNVYGAVTWGQFFVYQGFNEHCGWMHTSSKVDAADTYFNRLTQTDSGWIYNYDGKTMKAKEKKIVLHMHDGKVSYDKTFTALYTVHGPVMAKRAKWYVSVRADNRLMEGLVQCWKRNKAQSFKDFKETLDLLGNISNNTVYADAEGNIAYWHGNRIPIRDTAYNWNMAVDGSTSATAWKGYHKIDEIVHLINPPNGWLQNCNSTPFTVAGVNSPLRKNYPSYMAPDQENFRGINAVRVLDEENKYDLDKVIKAGYDTRLSAFEVLVPALIRSYNKADAPSLAQITEPINELKAWDLRCSESSVASTLAILWGENLLPYINATKVMDIDSGFVAKVNKYINETASSQLLRSFMEIVDRLKEKYGSWKIAWGDINRYQRISNDPFDFAQVQKFNDDQPSIPVGYASSLWGMLPSYASNYFAGSKKRYGVHGNSFVCAVEFGKTIKARSLLAGGESGDPSSKHFNDQMEMYAKGQFKDVLFYKEDVKAHAEKEYHPGD